VTAYFFLKTIFIAAIMLESITIMALAMISGTSP